MSYQALYRVWRSQRFDEIVGQQTVTQTLKNALIHHKTSHAYLFTGPRGTGKTSAAKIFAKAINCPNQENGEPCNQCDICQQITEGSLNDVIEIDAASNNGVEEIRDIREKVKYAPTQSPYKVYIIDEVHMLSTGAFNALLKTLEEPPKNVVFILATTEPHKIPATIISRTQRFDFKRIRTEDIVTHLRTILDSLNYAYEERGLFTIARAANGGMRDALSLLDQTLSFSEGEITVAEAVQVTGSLTQEMMADYLTKCYEADTEAALQVLADILAEGKESHRFIEDVLLYCRDLLIQQQAPALLKEEVGEVTEEFRLLAEQIPSATLYDYISILNQTQSEMRLSSQPQIYLEVVTVKLAHTLLDKPQASTSIDANELATNEEIKELRQQISEMKKTIKKIQASGGDKTVQEPVRTVKANSVTPFRVPKDRVYKVLQEATRQHLDLLKDSWPDMLQTVSVTQRAMLKASEPVAASAKGFVIAFDYEIVCQRAVDDEELLEQMKESLRRLIQYTGNPVMIPREVWPQLRQDYIQHHQGAKEDIAVEDDITTEQTAADELVKTAIELFGEDKVEIIEE
ncbi:DNA polymerase III subunit gamma/tau [Vagococcus lutrae]|uniref:DNA polymerase III subunit gamma/tau n=1 Tax=Vagococcus lutrae TaxID=81947 RepID=UPI002A83FA6D|nr:DNA polymerase III subunit gamma/tau [Vagococcus lutrae]MDY3706312.1 DNA polymerase III subunit gamma/tau [Vagococcus lutrae]